VSHIDDVRLRPLRHGLRAWLYRGRRRASRRRLGHLATGFALYTAVHLR
jgi:hypothetical protein